jgi:hypothetical protein
MEQSEAENYNVGLRRKLISSSNIKFIRASNPTYFGFILDYS